MIWESRAREKSAKVVLVPVSFSSSRITHNNGVAGGASVDAALPFTVKLVVIVSSLQIDDGRET